MFRVKEEEHLDSKNEVWSFKNEKIKNEGERIRRVRNNEHSLLPCDPQKPVIIKDSPNKHEITSSSRESAGSSCITDSMDIWHEMLKWSFKVFT